MKFVYYGNYAAYFEQARVELLKSIGISYREIEEKGFWMPVSEYHIRYIQPARYDDILDIHTCLKKTSGARVWFEYEIYNPLGEKITEASTVLFFMDSETKKVVRCPDFLMKLITPKG